MSRQIEVFLTTKFVPEKTSKTIRARYELYASRTCLFSNRNIIDPDVLDIRNFRSLAVKFRQPTNDISRENMAELDELASVIGQLKDVGFGSLS